MTSRQRCRLFASLMAEQYAMLTIIWANRGYGFPHEIREYLAFLHKQRQHHNAYCPYSAAIRMISGDAR